jgi:hypothetical protein
MKITDLEHDDVVSIDRRVLDTETADAAASPTKPASTTSETPPVLATVRNITVITETVSLRRADTGEILTDVDVETLCPAPAATDEEYALSGDTTDESRDLFGEVARTEQ